MIGSPVSRGAVSSMGALRACLASASAVSAGSAAIAASVTTAGTPQRRISMVNLAVMNGFTVPCPGGNACPRSCGGSEVRIIPAASSQRGLLYQRHTRSISCSCPSIPRFANEDAAKCCELRNRDTSVDQDHDQLIRLAPIRLVDLRLQHRKRRSQMDGNVGGGPLDRPDVAFSPYRRNP